MFITHTHVRDCPNEELRLSTPYKRRHDATERVARWRTLARDDWDWWLPQVKHAAEHGVHVAGETLTYGQLADLVDRVLGHLWSRWCGIAQCSKAPWRMTPTTA